MRYGEGESVSVALPLTQPRNIKLKIYVACSQCLNTLMHSSNEYFFEPE